MQIQKIVGALACIFFHISLQIQIINTSYRVDFSPICTVLAQTQETDLLPQIPLNQAATSLPIDNSLSISGEWFLSYQIGKKEYKDFNNFNLKRGYITIKKTLSRNIIGRITPDISVDRDGDGEGDIELRLKYCYINFLWPTFGIFNSPQLEFGLVHRPWLDFEEHINRYRVQGTMFLERNGVFDSGDYGVTFMTLLGEEMSKEYQREVNKSYPGRFGSLAIGLYNGGGYHALERNKNKTLEWRMTLRPLPEIMPGLQMSYLGAYGKGNQEFSPAWELHDGCLSYELPRFIFTAQYFWGKGNAKGTLLDASKNSIQHEGYSCFGEIKLHKWNLIGRYDFYEASLSPKTLKQNRHIGGIAYNLGGGTKILVDYEVVESKSNKNTSDKVLELAMEVRY
ncbi:hypothetical protein JW964_16310 [candidate division KSB1 bacterium]|nr:hypothetical protein [candidate division KSB1 bacterium]